MTPVLAQGLRADRSFERIYRRHVGDVYRYALAVLRNAADAEDVTQTTFMNAYRAYAGGERPREPHNWLIAIAHNVCRQRFRQSQRRPQEVAFDDNVGDWLEDDDRGPTADELRRALSHLAFNQRAALVMRELEGRSYVEIAEILGLSVAAVETLLFRARRSLREQLEGALTCAEAERALSLEADGRLPRAEKGPLRAHLRACGDCASAARRQRAQRSAWKALGALPVPASLSSLFGGGGAAIGVKAAAVAASAVAAGGLGVAGERHFASHAPKAKRHQATLPAPAASAPAKPVAAAVSPAPAVVSTAALVVTQHGHTASHDARTAVERSAGRGRGSDSAARAGDGRSGGSEHQGGASEGHGGSPQQDEHSSSPARGDRHEGNGGGNGHARQRDGHGTSGRTGNRDEGAQSERPAADTAARETPKQHGRANEQGAKSRSDGSASPQPSGGQDQRDGSTSHGRGGGKGDGTGGDSGAAVQLPDVQVPELPAKLPEISGD